MALVLLALVCRRPMHGYELLAELERVVPGYSASPGSVYPALAALVDERLLDAAADRGQSRRRAFKITASGRAALDRRSSALAAFEVRTGARLSYDDTLDTVLDRLRARVMAIVPRPDPKVVDEELNKAADALERAAGTGGVQSG